MSQKKKQNLYHKKIFSFSKNNNDTEYNVYRTQSRTYLILECRIMLWYDQYMF